MNVIALEIFLENHEIAIRGGGIDKVIDQEIKTHPRRHTKNGRKSERDHIRALQQFLLGLSFCLSVERYRLQRCFLGTEDISGFGSVAAVGGWINDQLSRATDPAQEPNGFEVHGTGQYGIPIARGR